MFCCALLAQPKEYKMMSQLNKYRENYICVVEEIYHTSTTYIHETHKHINNHMQEKMLSFSLT
jgi:hypothetical protein